MSTDKSSEDKIRQLSVQEATLVARAVQLDDAERRLRELEQSGFARHTQTMTWILTVIGTVMGLTAVMVTLLSYSSRTEALEQMKDARQQLDHETEKLEKRFDQMKSDFQQQFNIFAGDALKKPKIDISISAGPLTNQILHLIQQGPQLQIPFYPLFVKNLGQKSTGPLSISLYSSVSLGFNGQGQWEPDASNEPNYPFKYHYQFGRTATVGLAPGEPMSIVGDWSDGQASLWGFTTNIIQCKFVVFYGNENPAEARFQLKFGP